jgi:hypothetical protein
MMRSVVGVLICVAGACYASGQTVQLLTSADLEKLRSSNPDHYQRAEKLMAAANKYCPIGEPTVQSADIRSNQIACGHLDMTSNPPKREIAFTLDGTHYIAWVTLTASPAKPMPAGQ